MIYIIALIFHIFGVCTKEMTPYSKNDGNCMICKKPMEDKENERGD